MKHFFTGLILANLLFSVTNAAPPSAAAGLASALRIETVHSADNPNLGAAKIVFNNAQQNLIGDVVAIDSASGKITVKTQTAPSILVTVNDKTLFRRIPPGQTSLANAEQIAIGDIKVGDRILVPGGGTAEATPVRQVIVMASEAIRAQRDQAAESRRARTLNGRITAINPEKKEIIIQARGRAAAAAAAAAEAITVRAAGNVKFLRYAPDSLRISDALPGSFSDLRVGDQIRAVGDRTPDGTSVTAEEIVSGSISRTVASIVDVNASRGEVTVKNSQTGQVVTILIGKNTTIRRITPEVAETLKQRANQRAERRRERASQQSAAAAAGTSPGSPSISGSGSQPTQEQRRERRNRRENRNNGGGAAGTGNANAQAGQGNRGLQQPFENLPAVTVAELKKGDAVLITGTGTVDNLRMTAVSIVAGDADLQSLLQPGQGGRNRGPQSPGLPGNVGGGNNGDDRDDPRN